MKRILILFLIGIFAIGLSGCALNFYKGKPEQERKIRKLTGELEELEAAKRELEERLSKEINDKEILLELAGRGLVITMANDILYDSGKAKLKSRSHSVLKRIASVIQEKVPDKNIGVEGHTDNVPIKYSGWKSNWELSTARATSVLHYLIDECGIEPKRLSAIGYGEYKPIDTNETKEGRAKNRRVEIIILPKEIAKKSYEEAQARMSEEARTAEESKITEGQVK
ncbi:MAG: OmpA family protein [Candidatus Omnitrophica bacterium]|nr:OmpA family protein [Candidatus Omnitrophota bacterium]